MPVPVLTTPRLRLRPTVPDDLDAVLATVTDPTVMRHLGGPRSPEQVRASFDQLGGDDASYVVSVADLASDVRVGGVRVDRRDPARPGHVTAEGGELELSYVFRVSAWGRGYAEEACRALLAHVTATEGDHAQPVLVVTQSSNTSSVRLTERLGFAAIATFEEFDAEQLLLSAPLWTFGGPLP